MAAAANNIRNRFTRWTQHPEPPIDSQHILRYPMITEEPMNLSDFLEMMAKNHPSFYYEVAPEHEEQIVPITSIRHIPTDRSFLVKQNYRVIHPKKLCSTRTSTRGKWNRSCLVQPVTEHTGYLMFFREATYQNFDEYACMMTYYDGSSGNYRIVYKKDKIMVTPDDWAHLIATEQLWINPSPIVARFRQNDSHVLEKTRKHRIPVIVSYANTGDLTIYVA